MSIFSQLAGLAIGLTVFIWSARHLLSTFAGVDRLAEWAAGAPSPALDPVEERVDRVIDRLVQGLDFHDGQISASEEHRGVWRVTFTTRKNRVDTRLVYSLEEVRGRLTDWLRADVPQGAPEDYN